MDGWRHDQPMGFFGNLQMISIDLSIDGFNPGFDGQLVVPVVRDFVPKMLRVA